MSEATLGSKIEEAQKALHPQKGFRSEDSVPLEQAEGSSGETGGNGFAS
jgi:hypothetical protein